MKESFKLSVLAIACGIALSACSSGGGGSPSVQPNPNPAPTPQQQGNNGGSSVAPTNPSDQNGKSGSNQTSDNGNQNSNSGNQSADNGSKPVVPGTFGGSVLVAKKQDTGDLEYGQVEAPVAKDKNSVVLDGVAIDTKQVKAGEFTLGERSTNGGKADAAQYALHSGDLLPDVRYGGVADVTDLRDVKQALFIQGTRASDNAVAAQKGEATYKGIGLHFVNGMPVNTSALSTIFETDSQSKLANLYPAARATDVTAKVNFDQKTINVGIKRFSDKTVETGDTRVAGVLKSNARDMANDLSFDGTLNGNTFSNKQGTLQGGFYGATADQLAGMYSVAGKNQRDEDVTSRGVFGAKRQDTANIVIPTEQPKPETPAAKPDTPAATAEVKTGETGEKYLIADAADLTKVVIDGTAIALAPVGDKLYNSQGLVTDGKSFVASNNLTNVVIGAAKLADDAYSLFVQGTMSASLPSGTAKYSGDVLNFRARNLDEKKDWMDAGESYRTVGSFTADVDFDKKTIVGNINSGDNRFMSSQGFTADIAGSGFSGKWTSGAQGSVSGGFYGNQAAEMAGRYSYNKEPGKNGSWSDNAFGVFGGKKQ